MNLEQLLKESRRKLGFTYREFFIYIRMLTATKRALPDYLIVGAQRAGTTSLYACLLQHPNILPAYKKKEIHFWDNPKNYKKGWLWYQAHFPLLRVMKAASAITGDKTPNYLENPEYIRRIQEDIPAMKLIILLRNPVERAISNYFMLKKRGFEELPIMDALLSEEERLTRPSEQKRYGTERAYKMRGIYAPSIKACLDYFPPEQTLILDSNSFFKTPSVILKDVFNFLGVSIYNMQELTIHRNLGGYDKSEIPPQVYKYLQNFFRPYNEELYSLLGRDFGWDKSPSEK